MALVLDPFVGRQAITLTLPWPPSINHYWRHWRGRVLISAAGRDYRRRAAALVVDQQRGQRFAAADRLAAHVVASPPDRRRRDLDNLEKALFDSLAHAGVYADDSQIDWKLTERAAVIAGGCVRVALCSLTEHATTERPHADAPLSAAA